MRSKSPKATDHLPANGKRKTFRRNCKNAMKKHKEEIPYTAVTSGLESLAFVWNYILDNSISESKYFSL
jgi:hypothetical protein